MFLKNCSASGAGKLLRYSIEMKKETIQKHESGVHVSDLAKFMICSFIKHKWTIKTVNVAKGVFG